MAASMCKSVGLVGRCLQTRFDQRAVKVIYFCTKKIAVDKATTDHEADSKNAKGTLHNILQVVASEFKNNSLLPKIHVKQVRGNSKSSNSWEASVCLKWPQSITTTYTASTKATAQRMACWQAIQIMMKLDVLTKDMRPRLFNNEQLLTLRLQQNAPKRLRLSYQVEWRMRHFIKEYMELCRTISDVITSEKKSEVDHMQQSPLIDVITGRPIASFDSEQASVRNNELLRQLVTRQHLATSEAISISEMQSSLPIHAYKDHILSSVEEHQVIVVSGETGCGKTTQLPQYIFDQHVLAGNGSACNIVVTQPRRLAAISVATRVAYECKQQLGESVGYQVRLSSVMPRDKGAILFCTGGILLQRLINNPKLEGVSHIVLDEAHERSVVTDFILVLLKDLMKERPSLRVIIMSASMNVEKLSSFFGECPIIKIPGFTHPVKDHSLPAILKMTGQDGRCNSAPEEDSADTSFPPPLSYDFVAEVIYWIDQNRPPGGILCFLPGWQDINGVQSSLKKIALERGWKGKRSIIPVHSLVPLDRQASIFESFTDDERKIVLSTNIAETSITVPDVSYVIDSGRCKDLYFDSKWGASSLQTQWVSKANVVQRRGRAGRTHPGECFHLYSKEVFDGLEPFPVPEMRRISLEKVILDAKLYCNSSAESFLARCPDPPHPDMVALAIKDLFERGFLTSDMKLTALGHCATAFPCHPYVAKAVMYGRWMRCLDPLLTVAAYLSADSKLFRTMPDERSLISQIKMAFADETASDHWSIYRIYREWDNASRSGKMNEFCEEYFLNKNALKFLQGLKNNLASNLQNLKSSDIIDSGAAPRLYYRDKYNKTPVIMAGALAAGFSPNFLRRVTGAVNKSKIIKDEIWLKSSKRVKAHLQRDSLNYAAPPEWLTYLHMMQSGAGRYTTVRETSAVSPFAIVILAGQHLECREVRQSEERILDVEDPVVLSVDKNEILSFYCSRSDAKLLCDFRHCVSACFQHSLCRSKLSEGLDTEQITACENEALAILSELFHSYNEIGKQNLNMDSD